MRLRLPSLLAARCLAALCLAGPAAAACDSVAAGKCHVALPTGIGMAYVETGPAAGPAVILVHGLTDSARSWAPAMAALHARDPALHLLAIDLRGHGDSSMPPAGACAAAPEACFRMTDLAADLAAFMAAKGIGRATLAGHSLGSFVVQELALDHPVLVERAVLVASASRGTGNPVLRDLVLKEPVEGRWRAALAARGLAWPQDAYALTPLDADAAAEAWIATNWDVDPLADPAQVAAIVAETARVRLGTWIGATRALLMTDNMARLGQLTMPVLVLWGPQDTIFRVEDQAALRRALPRAAWRQLGTRPLPPDGAQADDIGHNVQWDAPAQVAAAIDGFIRAGR